MTKFFLIVIAVLFVVCIMFFFLWRSAKAKQKSQKETIGKLVGNLNELRESNCKLEQSINILKTNREKADEKIRDLYSGDAVDNAIKHLSKQQN